MIDKASHVAWAAEAVSVFQRSSIVMTSTIRARRSIVGRKPANISVAESSHNKVRRRDLAPVVGALAAKWWPFGRNLTPAERDFVEPRMAEEREALRKLAEIPAPESTSNAPIVTRVGARPVALVVRPPVRVAGALPAFPAQTRHTLSDRVPANTFN
jgi:hypothetical protein